jgi:hypothetical protein
LIHKEKQFLRKNKAGKKLKMARVFLTVSVDKIVRNNFATWQSA